MVQLYNKTAKIPAMIDITDDRESNVFIGFSNSLKNLIGDFYRSSVEVV